MTEDPIIIAWAAGLFDGEGYIYVTDKVVKVTIEMTDLDLLERMQQYFGGSVYQQKQRQAHWKTSWRWYIHDTDKAQEFLKKIYFLLCHRRQAKADEAFLLKSRSVRKSETVSKVLNMRAEGMTHQAIADILECDRSYVSHILRKC